MDIKLIITGNGGQGIVFLTRLFAQTAVALGHSVMVSETHGMSQRGGSVISYLKINGDEAPLILRGTADFMIALDSNEAVRNLALLRRAGIVFVNADDGLLPEVESHLERLNIQVMSLPASSLALELGASSIANIIMAGFVVAHPALDIPMEKMTATVEKASTRNAELNLKALETGYQAGMKFFSA
jgi:indolepyruvate ferredoxin oxidoreductase beta subunit